jgi:putative hydrolase of the HAD superfamily
MTRAASYRVIIFDLDDTLYREHEFVLSGFRAVDAHLKSRDIHGFGELATSLFLNGERGKIFDSALTQLSVEPDKSLVSSLVEVYRAHTPTLTLLPDAAWALSHFGENAKIGLLTDGFAATQRNKVSALGLNDRFGAIMFTDDLGREHCKPSRLPFEKIATILNGSANPETFVYVADNPRKDFVAPNALGWTTVRVRREGGEYFKLEPELASYAPKFEIQNLEQLTTVLD